MEKRLTFYAGEEHRGISVKRILHGPLGLTARQVSRAKFLEDGITVLRSGHVQKVTVRFLLEPGDLLTIKLEEKENRSGHLLPFDGELDIVYEDEDLILINKPAGMVVHPSPGHYRDSLANILAGRYREEVGLVIRPVGRLDKDTSGLIFMAKNAAAVYRLEEQRKCGQMKRRYLALVEGEPEKTEGTIEAPIGAMPGVLMKQEVRDDGAFAKTDYEVLQHFEPIKDLPKGYSLVRLKLHTGRTHQIRVHMAHIGCPLLGDPLYGKMGAGGMKRAALHSYRIELVQPFTGEALSFETKMPGDMASLCPLQSLDL